MDNNTETLYIEGDGTAMQVNSKDADGDVKLLLYSENKEHGKRKLVKYIYKKDLPALIQFLEKQL